MITKISRPIFGILCIAIFGGFLHAAEVPLDDSNSWPFSQPADTFTNDALLDLRSLNEKQSGQSGFISLSLDKNDFVRGDGEPIRFWAVGTDAYKFTDKEMNEHCRWLAKIGVNLARLHVTVCVKKEGAQISDVNQEIIDGCHRFIKAAKDNGIYVLISPYYAHFDIPESWGVEGGKQHAVGLIFFNSKVQQAYKKWTRTFYTSVNPHTGLPIAKDPTVAILQIHNEDSLFFWTSAALIDPQKKKLGKHFADWLGKKHGSLETAFLSWGDAREHEYDDPANGVAGVFDVYFLTQDWKGDMARRIRDQTQFLAEFQHQFYADMGSYLRDDLGCRQLLNATNWRTADDPKLKALERHSYHALDIDAENEYVGSDFQHKGGNDGYRIDPGDFLVNESVLPKPYEMCTNWTQEEGHPFIVTETAWKNPNRYQSEGPFLVAAYQSLNGVDAVCWFSCQTPRYEENPLKSFWRIGDQLATHKWNHCYPGMMAGFPANALLFRKGYLKQAKPVVIEARPWEDLWNRKAPRISDNETYGDQRNPPDLQPGWKPVGDEINRVAFQIGAVHSKLGANSDQTLIDTDSLSRLFNPEKGEIHSSTEELVWNYRDEICTMNTPKAQGITGFLKKNGGTFTFTDLTIESQNRYATINVVSLDDRPLGSSEKVLIQVVTVNRLSGYKTKEATFAIGKGDKAYNVQGEQIVRIGKPPYRIANTEVCIKIKNPKLTKATVLDINGYPVKTMTIKNGVVTLPSSAIYTVLQSGE